MKITRELLESFSPCRGRRQNYLLHYEYWEGTPLEFLELKKITPRDKKWVLLRKEFFSEKDRRLMAADFAESVLPIFESKYPEDKRPRDSILAARKFAVGEISEEELAAVAAAVAAAEEAAEREAVAAASRAAAWTAREAAREAARAAEAEAEKQLEIIKKYLFRG